MKIDKSFKIGNKEIYGKNWKTFFKLLTSNKYYGKIDWTDAFIKTYTYKKYKLKLTKSESPSFKPFIDFHVLGNYQDKIIKQVKKEVRKELMEVVEVITNA